MNKELCTIYDCEFNNYHDGVIIDNNVYTLDKEKKPVPAKEYVCEYVDFDMVQFYTGYYDESEMDSKKTTSKWGFFELSSGTIIVPTIYDYACPFYGDRARVKKNGKYGFIDPKGRLVVDTLWEDTASAFHRALCWVKKGSKFGYIDKNGAVVLSPQFEMAKKFQTVGQWYEDFQYAALVKKDGKYGYIDQYGSYIFEPNFHDAKEFWSAGYAPVMIYGKWGFIDLSGEFVVALQFDAVGEKGGFLIRENVDKEKTIFGRQCQSIQFYTVKKYGIWGLMDSDFNVIMPKEGVCYVFYRDRKIYIKDGKVTSIRELKENNSKGDCYESNHT